MARGIIEVIAEWDSEARVWVAEREDAPGLVAEGSTPEELEEKLKVLIPELLELNAHLVDDRGFCRVRRKRTSARLSEKFSSPDPWGITPGNWKNYYAKRAVLSNGKAGAIMKSGTSPYYLEAFSRR